MMVDTNSAKFISSLVKSLQMYCHGYMEFEDNIEIIGHINLRIDNRQKLDYIVNEQVSKQGQESTYFQSNSYHSLPPKESDRDQHSSRSSERALRHMVDSSMGVIGGTRVQVDLSGPSPVTRSTFASYHDGFLNPLGSRQTFSRKREPPAYVAETEETTDSIKKDSASTSQGHIFNHPHAVSKDVKHADSTDSARAESNMSVAVCSGRDRQQQNMSLSGHLQDIVIKAEPGTFSSPEKSGIGDNSMANEELMETSSAGDSTLQATVVSANTAHSQSSSFSSMSFTPPVSFEASLVPLDSERASQDSGRQGGVVKYASGSPASTLTPATPTALLVTQEGLRVLLQGTLPPSTRPLTLPTVLASTEEKQKPFTVLSSSQPAVKKPKMEATQSAECVECKTQFRNSRLLGMHMRLVHRKIPSVKSQKQPVPEGSVQSSMLSSSPPVVGCVATNIEKKESARPAGIQVATESFLELTKSRNGSSSTITTDSFLELAKIKNESSDSFAVSQVTSAPKDSDKTGPVACCFCQILFWNSQDLSEHQKLCGQKYSVESGDGQSSSACQHCQLVFLDSTQLAEHKKLCNGELTPALSSLTTCPLCQLSFPDPALLSAHLWVCGKPSASASNPAELGSCESGASAAGSSSSSSSSSGNINACEKCGKVFQGRTSLVDHINSMHKGMSFKCSDCGETFKWRTCVYRHKLRCCKRKNAAKEKEEDYKN